MSVPVPAERPCETKLIGTGVSSGIAVGRVLRLDRGNGKVFRIDLGNAERVESEFGRLQSGVRSARKQLLELKGRIERELGAHYAYILDAHLLMLEDAAFLEDIKSVIRHERVNAEWAVKVVAERLIAVYASIKDDYLRERGSDIEDVAMRLIRVLSGRRPLNLDALDEDVILVADEMPPSFAAELNFEHVIGFASDAGGWASHTAIIARSLRIPAVVGLRDISQQVRTGDPMVLDGESGCVILHPAKPTLKLYRSRHVREVRQLQRLRKADGESRMEAISLDGREILLLANIELPEETESVRRFGAKGVGLLRAEFFFHSGHSAIADWPEEEEQYRRYRRIAEALDGGVLTIRAFDLGGDKPHPSVSPAEHNPALGLRGIRLLLNQPDRFKTQIRAVLRANAHGNLRFVLPMVGSVEEIETTREFCASASAELSRQGIEHDARLPIGAMIELPSAVLIADHLAARCDFFSLGTNDLVQYLLGVDRSNEQVASLYQPLHATILRGLKQVIEAARAASIPAEVCGEMASNPVHVLVLLALGFETLSMAPTAIPLIKKIIRSINLQKVAELVDDLIVNSCDTRKIEERLTQELAERLPKIFR